MKYFKFLFLFFALAVALPPAWAGEVTDVITASDLAATTTTYVTFSGLTKNSDAVYAGKTAKNSTGCIQLRSNNSDAGIITTTSGGKIKSVTVYFNANEHAGNTKSVLVFGKNTAYSVAGDLFQTSTKGTQLASISSYNGSGVETTLEGDYEYIGIRSYSGAVYLDKIEITWTVEGGDEPPTPILAAPVFDPVDGTTFDDELEVELTCATQDATIYYGYNELYQGIKYTEPITIDETTTIYAKSVLGDDESDVVSATYTKNTPEPPGPEPTDNVYVKLTDVGNVPSGTYLIICEDQNLAFDGSLSTLDAVGNTINVTIANRANTIQGNTQIDAATFVYNADAKTLKSASGMYIGQTTDANGLQSNATTEYTNTVTINEGYNADIVGSGGAYLRYNSDNGQTRFRYYKSSTYTRQKDIQLYKLVEPEPEQVATPTFSHAAGEYNEPITVTIACATEGATISYSTDGGNTWKEGTSVAINETTTVKAKANKAEMLESEIAEAAYTITLLPVATPTFDPAEGEYNEPLTVTIACATEGATISYSTDGGTTWKEGTSVAINETTTVKAKATKTNMLDSEVAEATYTITLLPVATPTFNPAEGEYNEPLTVTIACETEGATISYSTDGGNTWEEGTSVAINETTTVKAKATKTNMIDSEVAEATYTITLLPVAKPVISPASGTYEAAQTVTITCGTADADILYSVNYGPFQPYTAPFEISESSVVLAKATKTNMIDSEEANANYVIDIPATVQTVDPIVGYYNVMNNGNEKYVNVAGRKTINFTTTPEKMAGTVIYINTDEKGQVQSLRSQAADLQGYANRAMRYVPEIVQLIVDKLHAEGAGNVLGETGYEAIMEKFNKCFDYHLYVEETTGGYRLYGKTPSMQPVVDFYIENKSKVDEKLPMLEQFINDAIDKVLIKTEGHGASILQHFSVHETWERMGSNLTEPVDEATTLRFYQEVLTNKTNVWNFAYETAMTYWERLKEHPKYDEVIKPQLGEFADYIEDIENVHPDFKYYIVQENNKIDYISQGNKDIIDGANRTIWTLEPRTTFVVNIPEENTINNKYMATLYTDFAYDLPEGVTAYKVTDVNKFGFAKIEALDGTIPAQTPVLLKADAAGDVTLTLSTATGTAPTDNLLVGADYFIQKHEIVTPQVEQLFTLAKSIVGDTFYANYIEKYEHLMLKTAGTVNNKYFWGLTDDDLEQCIGQTDEGYNDCEVRNLSMGENGLGFYSNMQAPANQAFLDNLSFNPVKLTLKGDVTRDGIVDIQDVTATIDIILGLDTPEDNYDYDAADFNDWGGIDVLDVTELIDYLLD